VGPSDEQRHDGVDSVVREVVDTGTQSCGDGLKEGGAPEYEQVRELRHGDQHDAERDPGEIPLPAPQPL
jgi:hypothetical protein